MAGGHRAVDLVQFEAHDLGVGHAAREGARDADGLEGAVINTGGGGVEVHEAGAEDIGVVEVLEGVAGGHGRGLEGDDGARGDGRAGLELDGDLVGREYRVYGVGDGGGLERRGQDVRVDAQRLGGDQHAEAR